MGGNREEKLGEFFPKGSLTEVFEYVFETATDAIHLHDMQENLATVDRNTEELTGLKREDLTGKSFRELIPPESLPQTIEGFQSMIGGEPAGLELRLRTTAENTVLVEVASIPFTRNGKTVGAL
jgi:PAS domain S-box-containing protein